jgi:uncharacterized protein (TIGR02246 family)
MLSPEDRWAIADVLSRYCFAADTRDLSLLDSVFTEDVECVFQTGARQGRDNVREFMGGILASLTATQHNLTSSIVTATDEGAQGTTYLVVQHVREGAEGGETYAMGGTYHDRLREEAGEWRIYRRELIGSWRSGNPAVMIRP